MSSLRVLLVALLMLFAAMNLKRECPYKTNATTHENTDSALSPPWPNERTNWTGETLSGCGSRRLVLGTRFQVENNNMSPCMAQVSNFSGHYIRNRSTLDIGVLGYIGIVQHKEHSPEVLSIPPGTPCIFLPNSHWHHTRHLNFLLAAMPLILKTICLTIYSESLKVTITFYYAVQLLLYTR